MKLRSLFATTLLCAGMAAAQQPMKTPGPGGRPEGERQMRRQMVEHEMRQRSMMPGGGKWWKNSDIVQKVGLSDSQVQQIEKTFLDYRLKLIDLHAALQKEEAQLEPLIESDSPDEAKITAQIDRVANARASLEKANALMFLGIRKIMTADQWKTLQEVSPGPPPHAPAPPAPGMKRRGPGGPGGPGGELDE